MGAPQPRSPAAPYMTKNSRQAVWAPRYTVIPVTDFLVDVPLAGSVCVAVQEHGLLLLLDTTILTMKIPWTTDIINI